MKRKGVHGGQAWGGGKQFMFFLERRAFSCAGTLLRVQEMSVGCIPPSASICNACAAVRAGCLSSFYRSQREIGSLACDSFHFRGNILKIVSGGGTSSLSTVKEALLTCSGVEV